MFIDLKREREKQDLPFPYAFRIPFKHAAPPELSQRIGSAVY
jgi:hypothetical protein